MVVLIKQDDNYRVKKGICGCRMERKTELVTGNEKRWYGESRKWEME